MMRCGVIAIAAVFAWACSSGPLSCRDLCSERETCAQDGCSTACVDVRASERALGCDMERTAYEDCMLLNASVCSEDGLHDACLEEVRSLASCQAAFCASDPNDASCSASCIATCQAEAADCETPAAISSRCEADCVTDAVFVSRAGCGDDYYYLQRCRAAHRNLCSMGALTEACGNGLEALSSCYMTYCTAFPDDESCAG